MHDVRHADAGYLLFAFVCDPDRGSGNVQPLHRRARSLAHHFEPLRHEAAESSALDLGQ